MDNNGLSSPGNHINPHNEATTPPILKRLMEKKERNKRKMEALGLKPMSPTPTKTAKSKDPVEEVKPKTDDDDKKRGMLPSRKRMRPHRYDTFQSLSSQFPCRHSQLRKLVAALQAASRQSQGYIPAPLFVSGPGGSGKTDVVKECVRFVDSVSAYVDCGLLDSNGVDEVTAMILNQLICHSGDEKESLGRAKMVSSASDIDAFLRDGSSVHCVWNFGLKLREMFQNKSLSHVVIVLDNANLLEYTDTFRKASERPHYLSQLLHLPHTLRLNILFVVIARSSTPWDVVPNDTHFAVHSNSGSIRPQRVLFDAYTPKQIKEVLAQARISNSIFSSNDKNTIDGLDVAKDAFLDTIVRFLSDSTCDINEYMNFGRAFWPSFASAVDSAVQETQTVEDVIKTIGVSFVPTLRGALTHPGGQLPIAFGATKLNHDMPRLQKMLVVAVFLCQANKAHRDKRLYSIQKNGRPSKRKQAPSDGDEDRGSLYQRLIPEERILSVYTNIASLHYPDEQLQKLHGAVGFFEDLSNLCKCGILERHAGTLSSSNVGFSDTRYACFLNEHEVKSIAKSIQFPIHRYLD